MEIDYFTSKMDYCSIPGGIYCIYLQTTKI